MTGYELVRGKFQPGEPCGDHAGKWETSLLMYLDPGMQKLELLPEDRSVNPIGASNNGVQDSNAEFGKAAVEAILACVDEKVKYFLDNHASFQGHGCPM